MGNSNEMNYENFICKIWETSNRMGDPFGLADTDTYENEIENLGERLLFSLEAGLRRLKCIFENDPKYSENNREYSKNVLERFSKIKTPDDFDEIIKESLKYLEGINF